MRSFTQIFLLVQLIVVPAMADTAVQSQADFETAMRDNSTAPYYVLVTIVDDRNGQSDTRCVPSNGFKGAIHREYGLGYDRDGQNRALEIALSHPDHVFHFSKPEALNNMHPDIAKASQACAIIARGGRARLGDRVANVFEEGSN